MDQRHSDLLLELRYAMDEAFGKSERVISAIMALQRSGKGVKIAIDTALVDIPVSVERSSAGGLLILNAFDMRFLRDLKISVETAYL
jgi:hypothetical protein